MRKSKHRDDEKGIKRCPRCETWKLFEEFGESYGVKKVRPRPYCQVCRREMAREFHERNRDRVNSTRKLGPNREQLNRKATLLKWSRRLGVPYEVLAESDNPERTCDICGRLPDGRHKRLHIDHSHETGQYRGLLCESCNLALGKMEDDPKRLRRAAEYLEAL